MMRYVYTEEEVTAMLVFSSFFYAYWYQSNSCMTTTSEKKYCVKCSKDKATLRCGGCLQEFCNKYLGDHQ